MSGMVLLAGARFEEPRSTAAAAETEDQLLSKNFVFIRGKMTGSNRLKRPWTNQLFFLQNLILVKVR